MLKMFSEEVLMKKCADHTTAGTSDVEAASVDMAGYDAVCFVTSFGTAASNNTIKAQQSSDDGGSDGWSDLEGTSTTSGSSDEDCYLDIVRPTKRYVRLVGLRGTSSTLESVWAFRYRPSSSPADNTTSGTITGEAHVSPAEGTA